MRHFAPARQAVPAQPLRDPSDVDGLVVAVRSWIDGCHALLAALRSSGLISGESATGLLAEEDQLYAELREVAAASCSPVRGGNRAAEAGAPPDDSEPVKRSGRTGPAGPDQRA